MRKWRNLIKAKAVEGDPEVEYFRKGSAASYLGVEDLNLAYFTNARHLHVTGIPLVLSSSMRQFAQEVVALMKAANKPISFDPNLRMKLWVSEQEMIQETNALAVQCNTVLPGIQEGKILTGYSEPRDVAAFYLDQGVELVVIKLEKEGAYYCTSHEEGYVSGFEVTHVVDTVGAGDGFAVGVISDLLEGLSYEEAVRRGNAIGAMAVMSPGDMDGLPLGSIAFDSAPALVASVFLSPLFGGIVGAIGHTISSFLVGFPLGFSHGVIAMEMMILVFLYGWMMQNEKRWMANLTFFIGNAFLAPLPLIFILGMGVVGLIPLLDIATAANLLIAFIVIPRLKFLKKRMVVNKKL